MIVRFTVYDKEVITDIYEIEGLFRRDFSFRTIMRKIFYDWIMLGRTIEITRID